MTKETFKQYYLKYFDVIRAYIYYRSGNQELATDIAQEAFMKIWEKQLMIDELSTKRLLYKIAGDIFVSYLRHKKIEMDNISEIQFRFFGKQIEEEDYVLKQKYQKALAELPEKQRVVFLMNKIDGLTHKEIAVDLSLSIKAVEKRMGLALKFLKKKIASL